MSATEIPLISPDNSQVIPLSKHVKQAMALYFSQMQGHETAHLYQMVINEVEKPLLIAVLEQAGYNQSKAAKMLGLSRSTLRKKMDLYQIS